jgi:CRP-like cAMP-binding protein
MSGQLKLKFVNFSNGAYIFVEGKHATNQFFIIFSGEVAISKSIEGLEEERGSILGPGDFLGVVSTMSSHSHIETARALTDVSLISVQKDQYLQLIQQNAPVAMKIMLQFSRRVRYLDEVLTTALTLKHTGESGAPQLFTVGEYYAKRNQYPTAFYAYNQYIKYNPNGPNAAIARMRMMKIAPYAKGVKFTFNDDGPRDYVKDSMIFAEGEWGGEFFIIQRGSVKITKIVDDSELLLAVLKTGDIFGEMALLESKPRAASAVAYEDCKVLPVNRANFETMIAQNPQMIVRLTALLSERIWSIYRQLANTLIENPLGRLYDALLIQLEKSRVDPACSRSFYFDIGPAELVNMVGIPPAESRSVLKNLLEHHVFKIVNDRIYASNASEIFRQSTYYKKVARRDFSTRGGVLNVR